MSARLSVAPMMKRTDAHYRVLARCLVPDIRLYTEMVPAGALAAGNNLERFLHRDEAELPTHSTTTTTTTTTYTGAYTRERVGSTVLQLGGSDADALARATELGNEWGFDEINLNCGCPSPRVSAGAFGAYLMTTPAHTAQLVQAMTAASDVPVSVKHRLGVDDADSYEELLAFVDAVTLHDDVAHSCESVTRERDIPTVVTSTAAYTIPSFSESVNNATIARHASTLVNVTGSACSSTSSAATTAASLLPNTSSESSGSSRGVTRLTVHARKAILGGLSPKKNLSVPPLNYDFVYRLKADRPHLWIEINGGISDAASVRECLRNGVDSVMVGRRAWSDPKDLVAMAAATSNSSLGESGSGVSSTVLAEAVHKYADYAERARARGHSVSFILRPLFRLYTGLPCAGLWRKQLASVSGSVGPGGLRDAVVAALAVVA